LHELGQSVTLENVAVPDGAPRPAGFLKINPRGNVPVLKDSEIIIREGGAILAYLLDKHQSPMLPKDNAGRAKALEWLMFANASMHPAYSRAFFIAKSAVGDAAKKSLMDSAIDKINQLWADVDQQLSNQPYVCGDACSAADILLAVIANWAQSGFGKDLTFGPNLTRMLRAVSERPAFKQALDVEEIQYRAAA